MKSFLMFIAMVILALCKISFGQDAANNDLIDQGLLLEDYDFLLKTLEETHPNLYAYVPKDEFVRKTDEFRASINGPMSKPDFHKILLSDTFIILDEVQFEKNSFANRNKIKTTCAILSEAEEYKKYGVASCSVDCKKPCEDLMINDVAGMIYSSDDPNKIDLSGLANNLESGQSCLI